MKIGLLEQRHPEHDDGAICRYRGLAVGGETWRRELGFWVPRNEKEPEDLYADRLKRALYHNYAGGILSMFAAYLFSEAPKVEGLTGPFYEKFLGNVDRRRTPWARWWRLRFMDALVGRQSFAWVNLPARSPDLQVDSRMAEERAGLLEAYLVPLLPEEVIDWGEDETGGLSWVLVRQHLDTRAGVDQARARTWRWTFIDQGAIRQWEWKASKDKPRPTADDDADEVRNVAHNIGRLPVVRLQMPLELWAMQLVHDPAVAACRARNDLSWALHRTAHAMPWIKRKWDGAELTVGAGYYLQLEPEDEFGWTEPGGNSFEVLREDAKDLKEEIFRVVHQMALAADNDSSRVRASGDSKQADWQAVSIVLSAYADLVLGAMRETAELVAHVRGESDVTPSVKGLNGWQTEDLATFLEGALIASPLVKSPTFKRVVARRTAERLLGDEVDAKTLETIGKEIDAADFDEPAPYQPPPPGSRGPGQPETPPKPVPG